MLLEIEFKLTSPRKQYSLASIYVARKMPPRVTKLQTPAMLMLGYGNKCAVLLSESVKKKSVFFLTLKIKKHLTALMSMCTTVYIYIYRYLIYINIYKYIYIYI